MNGIEFITPEISREDTRSPTPLLDDGRKRERFEREETGDTVPRTSERLLVKKTQSSLAEPITSMHESPQISKSQTLSDKITDLKRNCHDPNAIRHQLEPPRLQEASGTRR